MPSRTGSLVVAAACAIGAEPTPASLLKAERRRPWISTPTNPPAIPALGVKASPMIVAKAPGISRQWSARMKSPART